MDRAASRERWPPHQRPTLLRTEAVPQPSTWAQPTRHGGQRPGKGREGPSAPSGPSPKWRPVHTEPLPRSAGRPLLPGADGAAAGRRWRRGEAGKARRPPQEAGPVRGPFPVAAEPGEVPGCRAAEGRRRLALKRCQEAGKAALRSSVPPGPVWERRPLGDTAGEGC